MGLENYLLATLLKRFFNRFFLWSRKPAVKRQRSPSLLGQRPDSSWFFLYSRAQVTSCFTGLKCWFEKAKFGKQPVSKPARTSALVSWV